MKIFELQQSNLMKKRNNFNAGSKNKKVKEENLDLKDIQT